MNLLDMKQRQKKVSDTQHIDYVLMHIMVQENLLFIMMMECIPVLQVVELYVLILEQMDQLLLQLFIKKDKKEKKEYDRARIKTIR